MNKNSLLDRLAEREIFSVSQLNNRAKKMLEKHFSTVWVEGEISNFSSPNSGHWYFTLKDNGAQIRCAMFKKNNQTVKFKADQGVKVVARAQLSLYEARGDYQLIIEHLEQAGIGELQKAFEALKEKLQNEGLFSPEAKKNLPMNPAHIGIVTSPTGAAIKDILAVLKRRQPNMRITLYPVSVQGEKATAEIVQAIRFANRIAGRFQTPLQALIIGRGGGSLEDLWCFNEEAVARAIVESALPIISAVGHEIDFTISDFVADQRAPTPSAAAELISTDQSEQLLQLTGYQQHLRKTIRLGVQSRQQQLNYLQKRLRDPRKQLQNYAQRIDDIEGQLIKAMRAKISHSRNLSTLGHSRLLQFNPSILLHQYRQRLHQLGEQLPKNIQLTIQQKHQQLSKQGELLHSLSPLAVLGRGYSITQKDKNNIVSNANDVNCGDSITTRLLHGELTSTVTSIKKP
ncbi:Exodeoxyribonuclease 7 large subunit [Sinobacterium norvegicum]|uniref:Exodeoxyribonuclease 7 large subunit n=1 Tax=Sinobacterium norvegicum TaxID=1641715 RepID=A0ABN8ELS5_9GAMM|nr:exodeoxyribonuclease VII large subunit [Sinobacterium norvegicum]CAH0992633.1 Exodeoxyribonuclease 7 large subunit [Sinobacterium norvegicum]